MIFSRYFITLFSTCLLAVHAVGAAPEVAEPAVKEKVVQRAAGEKVAPKTEVESKPAAGPAKEAGKIAVEPGKEAVKPAAELTPKEPVAGEPVAPEDPDDEVAAEKKDAQMAAVAKPVSSDPIQIYGWREDIVIKDVVEKIPAKLDTGALTSSIHAEEVELFERDGKKWVRFIVTDPSVKKPTRTRIEAPLVRIARIKEPGAESVAREVVKLSFTIGERKMRGEFTLNNRSNMLAPVLIGRSLIKDLGWIDASRTHLADQKIFR